MVWFQRLIIQASFPNVLRCSILFIAGSLENFRESFSDGCDEICAKKGNAGIRCRMQNTNAICKYSYLIIDNEWELF